MSLIVMLLLFSHFLSCIWILIGLIGLRNDEGWIKEENDNLMLSLDFESLYIASFYWVITSFSSIGYGEIIPMTQGEI